MLRVVTASTSTGAWAAAILAISIEKLKSSAMSLLCIGSLSSV